MTGLFGEAEKTGYENDLWEDCFDGITCRFLGCEPNLSRLPGYTEEAERFYSDPATWLQHIDDDPDMVVLFDTLGNQMIHYQC